MIKSFIAPRHSIFWINFWPVFMIQGIRAKKMNRNMTEIKVVLKEHFYNRNYVGAHFGGTLYSMCDPWFMLIIMNFLGDDYIVWDKSASINFIRPGKGTISGIFKIESSALENIKFTVDTKGHDVFTLKTFVKDHSGKRVARVVKEVFVKKK